MSKAERPMRFGPEIWVTIRETGEHAKIECWSAATGEYRLRSSRGLLYRTDEELDEVAAHPEAHLNRRWKRCARSNCGAPLTPGLAVCPRGLAPTCTCGRCGCASPSRARAKKNPPKARRGAR